MLPLTDKEKNVIVNKSLLYMQKKFYDDRNYWSIRDHGHCTGKYWGLCIVFAI